MIMRVVALFSTPKAKFARLRAVGKAWYGHETPVMSLVDVRNEERQLKLGEMVEVQFESLPAISIVPPVLEGPKLLEGSKEA